MPLTNWQERIRRGEERTRHHSIVHVRLSRRGSPRNRWLPNPGALEEDQEPVQHPRDGVHLRRPQPPHRGAKYNGVGHRISARYNQTAPWYHFAYDERWRVVEMYEDSDTTPTEQFWNHSAGNSGYGLASYIDDVILRLRDTNGDGTLDERRYYLQNWHHDVVALANATGSISERANYTAYGSPIGTFSSINNRKGYAGYEYDRETILYHARRRSFGATLGRWLGRDSRRYDDGMNLTAITRANPLRFIDPTGSIAVRVTTKFTGFGELGTTTCPKPFFLAYFLFDLPKAPAEGGWIVQYNDTQWNERKCNDKDPDTERSGTKRFFEAWRVNLRWGEPGYEVIYPLSHCNGPGPWPAYTDIARWQARTRRGSFSGHGTIHFFPDSEVQGDPPGEWRSVEELGGVGTVGNCLPGKSADDPPTFWDGRNSSDDATRSLEGKWACCNSCLWPNYALGLAQPSFADGTQAGITWPIGFCRHREGMDGSTISDRCQSSEQ